MNTRNHFEPALPRALKRGDTLGVVAPAGPFEHRLFDAGVRVLESMGFNLAIREAIFLKKGYLAGSDLSRADLLNRMFADPEIDGIICARGGYGTMRILPLLSVETIARHPKVFVGFSDITALLGFLVQPCRMVAFHGPTVTTLANGDPSTRDHFWSALTQTTPLTLAAASKRVIRPGRAAGRFLCGNLTLFSHLTGTPFQPDFKDSILLIEDQGEAPYRVDRMLTQMLLAGCFDGLAGLVLGSFNRCGPPEEIHRIVADRMGGLAIPVLAGFDVGHDAVNMTLPVGLPVQLDTASGTLAFSGPALRER
ncbi:peptidase S66 [Desulfosarcina alkanivorans]|uniref:Peptidase S66 n=1 Tax=Desulfosarcina alkanivorans TaxID=571177 RepID=A0A5K7YUG9_9BACT|nr:LD-carboxypeptidase [Desulfosarcina alkanivorans]BBO72085.1 peptidase S66 [Desulfosarcina alkanivorans]